MSDDNVIDFAKAKEAGTATTLDVVRRGRYCQHRRVLVDPNQRTVECGSCGAPLDPVDVLVQYAYQERTFRFAEASLEDIDQRVSELKREERNAKARLARARAQLETAESKK